MVQLFACLEQTLATRSCRSVVLDHQNFLLLPASIYRVTTLAACPLDDARQRSCWPAHSPEFGRVDSCRRCPLNVKRVRPRVYHILPARKMNFEQEEKQQRKREEDETTRPSWLTRDTVSRTTCPAMPLSKQQPLTWLIVQPQSGLGPIR